MYGFMGKLLFVDLGGATLREEAIDETTGRAYLGGYGLGAKILFQRQKAGVDPLGPENTLGFLTGVLTGTPALIGSRFVVVGKSPLTGGWGDANSGGSFGPVLKHAGYDGVFFTGQSPKPVYLLLENGKASLHDAADLWGKDTLDTEDILQRRHGKKAQVACIGPSGEKLSLVSCIITDKGRAAGRSGLGAVMGSKKLKAVVATGEMAVPLANKALANKIRRRYLTGGLSPSGQTFKDYGTCGLTASSVISADSPIKNWGGVPDDFPNAANLSDDQVIAEQEKTYGCWGCPIRCGGHMKAKPGRARVSHKPEYETLAAMGPLCLIDDLETVIKANDICNAYGLDTISACSSIAFATECYENRVISSEDTGGLELRWGAAEAALAMLEKMAKREGFGDVLADGVKRAAEEIGRGADQYAMHVGGQELPMHDPRFQPGLGLNYWINPTPARHTQYCVEWAGVGQKLPGKVDKHDFVRLGEFHKLIDTLEHAHQSAGLCMFAWFSWDVKALPEFLSAVTGWEVTMEECYETGERISNLRQAFNLREGITSLKLKYPGRMAGKPPLTAGPIQGVTLDLEAMARSFMQAMDWDPATGRPSDRRLKALGLDYVAEALAKI